jgi:hypothetical protein
VAKEYETKTGTFNEENYPKQLEQLRGFGVEVRQLPDSVRVDWAKSLAEWPKQMAQDLDKRGLPASEVLRTALDAAEKAGHKWPVRYDIE